MGKTVTFVVRVEHNRRWENPRHADWPTDPVTGSRYQEFPITLTGNQRQVVGADRAAQQRASGPPLLGIHCGDQED